MVRAAQNLCTMLRFLFTATFLCCLCTAQAQKHDYAWALGGIPPYGTERFFYDFNTDTPSVVMRIDSISTTNHTAAYCNTEGELMIFSNGLRLFNRFGQMIEDGDSLNPSIPIWQSAIAYPYAQTSFFLGLPGSEDIVCFISLDIGEHPYFSAINRGIRYVGKRLLVAMVDLSANGGKGKVIEKNRVLLSGNLGMATACRHANGRDWWVMVSDVDISRHYRSLLGPGGFTPFYAQDIGQKINPTMIPGFDSIYARYSVSGHCFSHTGRYYVDNNDFYDFGIYDFDRCTGLLSNQRYVRHPDPIPPHLNNRNRGVGGCLFSPDDRLYYRSASVYVALHPALPAGSKPYLIQYDLAAPDIAASADTINVLDPLDYFPHRVENDGYYGMELGPDGRIYTAKYMDGGHYYSSFKYPNRRGKASTFQVKKPVFPHRMGLAIPNAPNYRLGPLDGSPCDTLGIDNIPVANFRVDDSLGLLSRYFYDLSHHEPATWLWDFGDGTTSADTSALHSFPGAGIYTVCLSVSNANGSNTLCRDIAIGVDLPTSSPKAVSKLLLHPNPASDLALVTLPEDAAAARLLLLDAQGRTLRERALSPSDKALELKLQGLPNGTYQLLLYGTGGAVIAAQRLVVLR
jgi:PKD domain